MVSKLVGIIVALGSGLIAAAPGASPLPTPVSPTAFQAINTPEPTINKERPLPSDSTSWVTIGTAGPPPRCNSKTFGVCEEPSATTVWPAKCPDPEGFCIGTVVTTLTSGRFTTTMTAWNDAVSTV
ncbi:hypothetical protein F5Y19DRAFT_492036 [Xylariaceae sp. FL1651]|nr:hypothetical protein F5Y19DRAFT_492036 [Xylariaceae sp. FL1651]